MYQIIYFIYMYKEDLALNNLQRLICHKTKPNQTKLKGELITAIRNDTDNTMDNIMTITRKQKWDEKQLYGRFKRLINNISREKTWMWLRKGNFMRETESLRIAAQNNVVRIYHIKARIDEIAKSQM